MPTETTDLFLVEDLEDVGKTSRLAQSDVEALRAVADWIKTFVVRPHEDLGRPGTVCPFVPGSLDVGPVAGPGADRRSGCATGGRLDEPLQEPGLGGVEPDDGGDAIYKVIVVVFTDLSADRAQRVFDGDLEELAVPSYVQDGILFGPYYRGNEATALYNPNFRPFQSPVPFLFVRQGVVGDWKFFLDDQDWFDLWAHRYGERATHALAEELRPLPWRARRDKELRR